MANETYSIAALANELGVPRTTVNDWLTRYSGFVESEMVGKRRIYSARTLEVLRFAANLREAGKNAAEIENQLAEHFGIQPEVAAAPTAEPEKTVEAPREAAEPAPDTVQLPALRKLEENAMELSAFLAEMRVREARSARRSVVLSVLVVVLLIALAVIGVGAWQILARESAARAQEMLARQQEAAALQEKITAMQQSFAEQLAAAEKNAQTEREAAGKRHKMLQQELENARMAQAAEVARLHAEQTAEHTRLEEVQRRREAELAVQNAAEREQLLRKVQAESKATEKRLQGEIAKAREEVQKLSSELAKKAVPAPVSVPEVAPKPAVLTAKPESEQ